MSLQDDRNRIAAYNDATRTPMMQAVLGGPTNKKTQLQRQIDAERAALRPSQNEAVATTPPTTSTTPSRPLPATSVPMRGAQTAVPLPPSRAPSVTAGIVRDVTALRPATSDDPRSPAQRAAVSDQAQAEVFVQANKAPRSNALNAAQGGANEVPIPGSDMKYAGQYGDTAVIERPGAKGERSFSDTDGVAGTNRGMGGLSRPEVQQSAGAQLTPEEQYIKNTTMSDGTRVFGSGQGAAGGAPGINEQLHQARLDAIARGDNEAVTRSLMTADQRKTYDRQNKAYAQDPLKAYEIDQVTAADKAKSDATALANYRDDIYKRAGLDLRAAEAGTSAEKASSAKLAAILKRSDALAKQLFPGDPEAAGVLNGILEQEIRAGRGANLAMLASTKAGEIRAAQNAGTFDPQKYRADAIGSSPATPDFGAMDTDVGM